MSGADTALSCYAMPGTDLAYGASRVLCDVWYGAGVCCYGRAMRCPECSGGTKRTRRRQCTLSSPLTELSSYAHAATTPRTRSYHPTHTELSFYAHRASFLRTRSTAQHGPGGRKAHPRYQPTDRRPFYVPRARGPNGTALSPYAHRSVALCTPCSRPTNNRRPLQVPRARGPNRTYWPNVWCYRVVATVLLYNLVEPVTASRFARLKRASGAFSRVFLPRATIDAVRIDRSRPSLSYGELRYLPTRVLRDVRYCCRRCPVRIWAVPGTFVGNVQYCSRRGPVLTWSGGTTRPMRDASTMVEALIEIQSDVVMTGYHPPTWS
eukprot:555068-Rhodomonas_salina.4